MLYYAAPLEGITNYIYRNLHHRYFPGVDRYYMPFFSPTKDHILTQKMLRDIVPEHNRDVVAIPQMLTKCSADFIWAAKELEAMGHREVNLNLGCPSQTVVTKGKGSGFLAHPTDLDHFFEEVFSAVSMKISVKTRLGVSSPEEFPRLLEIYNKYPICELTIHPRLQKDFYKNTVNLGAFEDAYSKCSLPICYNGDLTDTETCRQITERFPNVTALMLGRGLITNPAVIAQAKGGAAVDKATIKAFVDDLCQAYRKTFESDTIAMYRMRELWFYLADLFQDSEKYSKKIKKSTNFAEYSSVVSSIFQNLDLVQPQE